MSTSWNPRAHRLWHYECTRNGTNGGSKRLTMHVGICGQRVAFSLSDMCFLNSDAKLAEFSQYYALLARPATCACDPGEPSKKCRTPKLHRFDPIEFAEEAFPSLITLILSLFARTPNHCISLQTFYEAPWQHYIISVVDEEYKVHLVGEFPPYSNWRGIMKPWLKIQYEGRLPQWNWSEMYVNLADPAAVVADRIRVVSFRGRVYFFKPFHDIETGSIILKQHDLIHRARLPRKVYVSRAYGIVEQKGRPLGLLLKYIEGARTLRDVLSRGVSRGRKEAWKKRLVESLDALHEADVLWVDVKVANILIDKDSKPYIVGFKKEGYDRTVLAKYKMNEWETDVQGLSNIFATM